MPRPVKPVKPHVRTVQRIKTAVAALAAGKTEIETARLLRIDRRTLQGYKQSYPELFAEEPEPGRLAALCPRPRPDRRNCNIGSLTRDRIRKATAMLAAGETWEKVADSLHVAPSGMKEWQKLHPEFWAEEYERAIQAAIVVVRRLAGTAAIAEDPELFIRQAMRCEKWLAKRGEPLFAHPEQVTLRTFYQTYYKPNRLGDATPGAIAKIAGALRQWVLFTGDPPLAEITVATLGQFKTCLERLPGRDRVKRLSPNTVRGLLKTVQTILDKAGPPGPRNRDAAGLVERPPWIKPPREVLDAPRIVSPKQLNDAYTAAVAMEEPRGLGFKAPAWWRALLVLAYNTGLRRRTLFELRMEWIDWDKRRIVVPPRSMKSKRFQVVHLNETAFRHLLAIRTSRELVFPWPATMRTFHQTMHRLEDAAGIPRREHFGLHDLRKTLATQLFATSAEAAQCALGHAGSNVTLRHYVAADRLVADALDQLEQPEAFTSGDK